MNKYYIEILVEKWNHAGTKARTDVALFLDDMQVRNLVFDKEVGRIEKFLFTKRNIRKKLNVANPGDMVVVSHRIFFEKADEDYLLKIIKDKHLKSVLLIHDVESLRQDYNQDQTAEEIKLMNLYDIIISHNASMTKWLKANGVTSHIINLELFDYFSLTPIKKSYEKDKGIIFAGNLEKSVFLTKLNNPKNKISLYGPRPSSSYPGNVEYFGSFSPSELPLMIEGSYGLIWDGESTETCTGLTGNYLKYNNPHKTSFYLSCGLPVVIWKEAALAPFIAENNLGIIVTSLKEMDDIISNISDKEYSIMKNNVLEVAEKVRNGFFTKKAIEHAASVLKEEK